MSEPVVVKIDRSTLRRNPRAGATQTTIPTGVMSSEIVIERDGRTYTLEPFSIPLGWENDSIVGDFYCRGVTGPLPHAFPCSEVTTGSIGAEDRIISSQFSRETQVIEHRPEPTWLYEYLPTPVTCRECGETFAHSELQSDAQVVNDDGDEACSFEVCPKCGAWDCCVIEYEAPPYQ